MELANLPSERKLWNLRKFYGGNGGCLPPTDPRILNMTPEQIDLEFSHMLLDQKLKNGNKEVFEDAEYEGYDEDTDKFDSKLSDMPTFGSEVDPHHALTVKDQKEDDWEDVETDDFYPSEGKPRSS